MMKVDGGAVVAIVGRVNVGKSTLFNRIIGKKVAIVDSLPGVTRDRRYGVVRWEGVEFTLVDTGGLESDPEVGLSYKVREQTLVAIQEADLVIFVVDGAEIVVSDFEIAQTLRKCGKRILLTLNKIDSPRKEFTPDVYELGFERPIPISALHGLGIDTLLQRIVDALPCFEEKKSSDEELIRVAIVGRPNVGKSSILNTLLGEERAIVDEEPGTTRDEIEEQLNRFGKRFLFIDTAGMKKKGKAKERAEFVSIIRAERSISRCDVALLIVDALRGIEREEKKITRFLVKNGCAGIICVNKWDLVKNTKEERERYRLHIEGAMRGLPPFPIIFVSAKTKFGISKILPSVIKVEGERNRWIPPPSINKILSAAMKRVGLQLSSGVQVDVKPPTFLLSANKLFAKSRLRYVERTFREAFGFEGTPIRLLIRTKKRAAWESNPQPPA